MNNFKMIAPDLGLLWLRLMMGLGMAYHGYGKVFGGYMPKVIEGVGGLGFPAPTFFAWAASLSELVGGLLIALGLGTRIAAFFVAFTMAVAAFRAHANDPFQVKELALAYLVISIAFMLTGPGAYSLDRRLCRKDH
jgi:putative oxidoreductase